MPDVLVLARDDQSGFEIEAMAGRTGLRAKVSYSVAGAVDWIEALAFDALIIDAAFPLGDHQKLSGALWNRNPLAACLAYRFDTPPGAFTEVRLYGAEVFNDRQELENRLRSLTERSKIFDADGDFEILVVEDLDSPRDIICMYIESIGFTKVTGVSSAPAAISLLTAQPGRFSCVVSDVRMPEMSGKELVEFVRCRENLSHIPIVMLTAYGTVDCLIDCLRAGASGFLVKPPRKKDLRHELFRARRIVAHDLNPRLASNEEAEAMRNLLVDKGVLPP